MKSECVALLLVLALCAGALGAKMHVDDDAPNDPGPRDPNVSDSQEDGSTQHPFDSIQEAIDVAQDGDTIVVAPGTYLSRDPWSYAELRFRGRNVRLISASPTNLDLADYTILRGVVIFDGTEDPSCLLQGFKIQNYDCGGILGQKTHATISHCIISGNGPCGATVLKDVYGRISNCLIVDNTTFHDCGVLPVVSGCHTLINCTIANNLSNVEITGVGLPEGGHITVRNCIIYANRDPLICHLNRSIPTEEQIEYCLISGGGTTVGARTGPDSTISDADPCFVQPGHWEPPSTVVTRATRPSTSTPTIRNATLVEGDYHLRSEGWRWSSESIHGSHWYFDFSTSPAVDAGDPMDSLGEEPERVPEDPEGQWGFNHAIDLGAYGGTKEASLSPTWASSTPHSIQDKAVPGIGAVDLRDFWPLHVGNRWVVHDPQGTAREVRVTSQSYVVYDQFYPVSFWSFETTNAPDWAAKSYCLYFNFALYTTEDRAALDLLPQIPDKFRAQYPQYLIVGATIQAPGDPFVKETVQYRSVVVDRGSLAEVLAGTSIDPSQLLAGAWPDVVALKETNADGMTGDPIAIFARGFGPLLIAGQPVEGAIINSEEFGSSVPVPRSARAPGE